MIIVADTSALIALAFCDALFLLENLFDKVFIPETVFAECTIKDKPESEKLYFFLKDKIVKDEEFNSLQLPTNLGKGEISAMALYKKSNADFLLLDDLRARKIALINEIKVIGSLGILLLAKRKAVIAEISTFLEKLKLSEIFFDDSLLNQIKELANE